MDLSSLSDNELQDELKRRSLKSWSKRISLLKRFDDQTNDSVHVQEDTHCILNSYSILDEIEISVDVDSMTLVVKSTGNVCLSKRKTFTLKDDSVTK